MINSLLTFLLVISSFSKTECLEVMADNNESAISIMIKKMETVTDSDDKVAYLGALKMKNAAYQKTPKERLVAFKEGKILLEKVITKDASNVEYRFLRFIVQENAPRFLKYNSNLAEDAAFIKKNYRKLSSSVQTAVKKYASNSERLSI